jgi:hypothetical protein
MNTNPIKCFYPDRKNDVQRLSTDSDGDIRVLTVKDGRGKELSEAKFVEILKEAKHRIQSATSLG